MNNVSNEDFIILICVVYFAFGGVLILNAYLNDRFN